MKKIGFIGYGLRSATMMKAFDNVEAAFAVAAVADPRFVVISSELQGHPRFADAHFYSDAEQMLEAENLDGVFLGTRCSLHTPLALKVLAQKIPLFIEKPVCIDAGQYRQLAAFAKRGERVVVSFPLRLTGIVAEMKRLLNNGALGRITMVQAVNNVPYGGVYYHSWYRNPAETGGLFLQKATHDIDVIHYLLGQRPARVAAMSAKLYFKGDRPAGLHCPDCGEYHSCEESSYVVAKLRGEKPTGDACCFAVDTGNEDGASAILQTDSGVIISYSQNFVVKKSAGRRGARFIGTEGSAEFDFYSGEIRCDYYRRAQTTVSHITLPTSTHWGGDEQLALAFGGVLAGEPSPAPLADGLVSAACCLAMKQSAESGQFINIDYLF